MRRTRRAVAGPRIVARMGPHVFAMLRVRDFTVARAWYERLLGPATFMAHATEAVWALADSGSVAVAEEAAGAGNGAVTVFVDDLDAHFAHAQARGARIVEPIHQHGYRAYVAEDPEGHHWTIAQARPTM